MNALVLLINLLVLYFLHQRNNHKYVIGLNDSPKLAVKTIEESQFRTPNLSATQQEAKKLMLTMFTPAFIILFPSFFVSPTTLVLEVTDIFVLNGQLHD